MAPNRIKHAWIMRKPSKEDLRNRLISYDLRVEKPSADFCVVDGGAALHKCPWAMRMTFAELAERFISGIISKYSCFGEIVMVFDGYDDELSTKTDEHEGRSFAGKMAANVLISATGDGKIFLRHSFSSIREEILCSYTLHPGQVLR